MSCTALSRLALGTLLCTAALAQTELAPGLRVWSTAESTRVVVETTGDFSFVADRAYAPERVFFDLHGARVRAFRRGEPAYVVRDVLISRIRIGEWQPGISRIVFDLASPADYTASRLSNPDRLIIEFRPEGASTTPPATALPHDGAGARRARLESGLPRTAARPLPRPVLYPLPDTTAGPVHVAALPDPTRARRRGEMAVAKARPARIGPGDTSLTRVLGLKLGRIVIDAGHGGHDTGTAGPSGYPEKDLALDLALRLGTLIESRMGSEVVHTRDDDVFIPLEQRTRIANDSRADLFISIHANSSPATSASGVETFYLNFTQNKYALQVAARENAASEHTINDLPSLVQLIARNDKVEESRQFAERVQAATWSFAVRGNSRAQDRGVKKAPFVVLVGARMPSILCEVGFLSNPRDEGLLKRAEHRQRLAEALYKGVSGYAATLSHFQIAVRKTDPQP
ncbi:MAG TPA: N-acetylmuramoyl-L-alanine amidase [Bryobacteraceae bacterium]|nr:N-acetylmuramoyl-L-alanine amidase [Bryobacteraceae bacterium]